MTPNAKLRHHHRFQVGEVLRAGDYGLGSINSGWEGIKVRVIERNFAHLIRVLRPNNTKGLAAPWHLKRIK